MRVVFAGTPEVAVPALDALHASAHELVGVVTRPDAPSGRGRKLVASPVALRAEELGLPVLKPEHPRDPGFQAALRELAPDACPVVAYGALLPQSALDIPEHGWINLHFSILPAWRGAAPVQHSIWAGDEMTGATTFRIVKELDAGPTYGVMTERIRPTDTAGDLLGRLAEGGADAAGPHPRRHRGRVPGGPRAARRRREPGSQDPGRRRPHRVDRPGDRRRPPGPRVHARSRRLDHLGGRALQGRRRSPSRPVAPRLEPGVLEVTKNAVYVGTATDPVELGEVKAFGKKQMRAADWARGVSCPRAPGSADPHPGVGCVTFQRIGPLACADAIVSEVPVAVMEMLDRRHTVASHTYNRWLIPPAALAVHLCIGQAYATSVYKNSLIEHFDASQTAIGFVFSIAIVMLGLSAAVFGTWVEKVGPRKAMFTAACCWSAGLPGGLGRHRHRQLWVLYLGLRRHRRHRSRHRLHLAGLDAHQVVPGPAGPGHRHGDHGLRRRRDGRGAPVAPAAVLLRPGVRPDRRRLAGRRPAR